MGLVGMMLSKLGREMTRDRSAAASSHLFTASGVDIGKEDLREWDFNFDADICLRDNVDGYVVTIAPEALTQLQASGTTFRRDQWPSGRDRRPHFRRAERCSPSHLGVRGFGAAAGQ